MIPPSASAMLTNSLLRLDKAYRNQAEPGAGREEGESRGSLPPLLPARLGDTGRQDDTARLVADMRLCWTTGASTTCHALPRRLTSAAPCHVRPCHPRLAAHGGQRMAQRSVSKRMCRVMQPASGTRLDTDALV